MAGKNINRRSFLGLVSVAPFLPVWIKCVFEDAPIVDFGNRSQFLVDNPDIKTCGQEVEMTIVYPDDIYVSLSDEWKEFDERKWR